MFDSMKPNYLSRQAYGEFLVKYPIGPDESRMAWIRRHNPKLPNESELDWTFRLCEDPGWADFVMNWPSVECPIELSEARTKKAGKPISNIELDGQALFIGGSTNFRARTQRVVDMINKMMSDRVARAKVLKNLHRNPGGEENPSRYGALYNDKATFHILLQHLRLESLLDVNIGVRSWPYTNQVMPSPEGRAFGSKPPEERETDPDRWLKTLDDDAALTTPHRMRDGRVLGPKATRVNGGYRSIWNVLATSAPVVDNKVLIRCHRLDYTPKADMEVDDPMAYRPRTCPFSGATWQLWDYYSAVIPMCSSGQAGFSIPGWMNPEKLMTYPADEYRHQAETRIDAVPHFFVPKADFEPIETWLSCIKGWDKAKLVADGRVFTP